MKGMGQIVTWSVRDETLHCNSMIRLFRAFVKREPEIWNEKLQKEIYDACRTIVDHEDAFIDLAFKMGPIQGLKADQVKQYIRWIGDRRLTNLVLILYIKLKKTLLDTMLNAAHELFEGRLNILKLGSWAEAFS